jgi:hypothetical protein
LPFDKINSLEKREKYWYYRPGKRSETLDKSSKGSYYPTVSIYDKERLP